METPILITDRLVMRPFIIDDVEAVFQGWESDADVARYMFWESHNDINKTFQWVTEEISKIGCNDWYRWAIVLKANEELIGTALLYVDEEYEKFEIAYNLSKNMWGFGYTTEAMVEVIKFATDVLMIDEIMARHADENIESKRVLEKLGFRYIKDITYPCNNGKRILKGKEYMYLAN